MKTKKDVRRFDYDGQITSVEKTPQGFLKVPGFATRTGVFPYRDPNGNVRRELRHPDDVFDPTSLATLKNAVVTLDHPPVMVTPDNFKDYSQGYTTDRVDINDNLVECDLIIAGEAAIDAVENQGLRELSSGYECDMDEEPGNFEGTPYDCRQRNIRYNHIAIVKQGRAGPEARLRMDSSDAVMDLDSSSKPNETENKDIVIGGETINLPSQTADIITSMMDRYDQMRGQLLKLEEAMGKQRTDMDINISGISPQVDVQQGAPDGRSAGSKEIGSKAPQSMTGGSVKNDDEGQKPYDGKGTIPSDKPKNDTELGAGGAASMTSDKDKKQDDDGTLGSAIGFPKMDDDMKQKWDAMKSMMDSMQAKMDEWSAGSKPKTDVQAESNTPGNDASATKGAKMDSKDWHESVKTRVKLEKTAEKLLPKSVTERFDTMSNDEIRAACIQARHPKADLKGKSTVYIQTRFDSIVESFDEGESTRTEMGSYLMSGARMDGAELNPNAARAKMIAASKAEWQSPLSAVKK